MYIWGGGGGGRGRGEGGGGESDVRHVCDEETKLLTTQNNLLLVAVF